MFKHICHYKFIEFNQLYTIPIIAIVKQEKRIDFVSSKLSTNGDEYGIRTRECMRERHVS